MPLHPAMQVVRLYPARVFAKTAPPNVMKLYENMLLVGGKRDKTMAVSSVSFQICCWSSSAIMYALSEIQHPEIRCD